MQTYKPVFIIGSYRGGTSLVFRLLSESEELWSLYRESNHLWQKYHRVPQETSDTVIIQKNSSGYFRNLADEKPTTRVDLERKFFDHHYHYSTYHNYFFGHLGRVKLLRDKLKPIFNLLNVFNYLSKKLFLKNYRFVDKTPPNIYRIDYLKAVYPDAKFIYLVRNREANIQSLIKAWTHPEKFQYKYRKYLTENLPMNIKGYQGKVWKFFIPLAWQKYLESSIEEVCAYQYDDAHRVAKNSFSKMDKSQFLEISFENLLAEPDKIMQEICDFAEINYSKKMQDIVKKMPEVNVS